MASEGLGHAPGQPAEVSLLACFEELLIECLSARSKFIDGQCECLAGDGVLKVPAKAARAWIRGMLSTPDQLRALDTSTLIECLKASEFFQDNHLVRVLCGVLGERLFSTDAAATNHRPEQPSAKRPRIHPAHVLDQMPTDLAVEVLRCAPGTISSQLRQLPQSLSSLVALAACPALAAACTLPSDCKGAASDLPTLTLCVDVGQAGDADVAALASAESASHNSGLIRGSTVAQGSIWVHFDDESNISTELRTDQNSLFSLQQRPHVVACPLLARSDSLSDLSLKLPDRTCLLLDSRSAMLDVCRAKFEGGAVVCMGSTCSATFHDAVFDKCSLVVMEGAQVTLHKPQFKNMNFSEAHLSVCAHGSGSQVHLQGGAIAGGVQGVAVHAAARLQASDLTVRRLQFLGLEVGGVESVLTVERGTIDGFLEADKADKRFLDEFDDVLAQHGVVVHSHGSAQLSGVAIAGHADLWGLHTGCSVTGSATATLADCTVSGTHEQCVAVVAGSTAQLDNCTLTSQSWGAEEECVRVCGAGSNVTVTSCHLRSAYAGVLAEDGGRAIAHACKSSESSFGYFICEGEMELLNCASDGDEEGCHLEGGRLTATNVAVTNSVCPGFLFAGGYAELRSCSVTGSVDGFGMVFGRATQVRAQDCTVAQNDSGGFKALEGSIVDAKGCRSKGNGGAGFWVGGDAQMTVAHSSSDGDAAGCVAEVGRGGGGGVLTMEEVTVDGVVRSGTVTS